MKPWFTDPRRIALVALLVTVLADTIPVWNSIQQTINLQESNPDMWWVTPLAVLVFLLAAILLLFYFALFRNEGDLHFARRFRRLAIAGALSLGLFTAMNLPKVIRSFGAPTTGSVLFHGKGDVATTALGLLSFLSNLASIWLLIAIFHRSTDETQSDLRLSRLLTITAKAATIALGLWVAFSLFRLVLTPVSYLQIRDITQRAGRESPRFTDLLAHILPELFSSIGLFIAPYIIYKSQPKRVVTPG